MRGNNLVKFLSVILIIGILTYIAIFGELFGLKIPGARDIRFGIDTKGGIHAQLQGKYKDGSLPKASDLETAKALIGERLDRKGITDRNITTDVNTGRIIVEIPWKANEKDFNPQKLLDELGEMALLTFQEVDETKVDANGDYIPADVTKADEKKRIILEGADVVDAVAKPNQEKGGMEVQLTLSNAGTKKFSVATGRLVGKPIAIYMDNKQISAPVVNSHITTSTAVIELNNQNLSSKEATKEAKDLAAKIRSGSLPISLEAVDVNSITPTLGENALNISVRAGMVALLLVWAYMLFYYRLPGLLADVALLAHTVIQLLAIAWIPVINLTLPGIAGVILSVGMGVDANVIIFERIKEELRNGKTLRAAIDVGFKRAFTAILDANVATLISAIVLGYFGTGPIKGFAYTLGLGVALSFLTAVLVSRIMLKSVAEIDIAKHHWLYGV